MLKILIMDIERKNSEAIDAFMLLTGVDMAAAIRALKGVFPITIDNVHPDRIAYFEDILQNAGYKFEVLDDGISGESDKAEMKGTEKHIDAEQGAQQNGSTDNEKTAGANHDSTQESTAPEGGTRKIYCKHCGTEISGEMPRFCPKCGSLIESISPPPSASSYSNPVKKKPKIGAIICVAIGIIVLLLLLHKSPTDRAIADCKDIVFSNFGTVTIEKAASATLNDIEWTAKQISDKHFTVTLKAFVPEFYSHLTIDFDITYSGENVYGSVDRVGLNGEYYDDFYSIALVMAAVYGN